MFRLSGACAAHRIARAYSDAGLSHGKSSSDTLQDDNEMKGKIKIEKQTKCNVRACLKNHSQHLHSPLCTMKGTMYHTLWVHMPESIFQTRSRNYCHVF